MATVKQLEQIVVELSTRVEKLEEDNEKIIGMLQAAIDECKSLQSSLAAAVAKQGQPKACGGAKEETFASIKEAMAAAKVLATSGKARAVKLTGTTVSYYAA